MQLFAIKTESKQCKKFLLVGEKRRKTILRTLVTCNTRVKCNSTIFISLYFLIATQHDPDRLCERDQYGR